MIAAAALTVFVLALFAGALATVSVPDPLREHEALLAFVLGSSWVGLIAVFIAAVAWIAVV
ncbi:MAG: hypothetical protein ACXIUP_07575 [Microcella sp.]